ncbi:MAG: aminotransferase class IV [Phycisphaerales bacterium]|nr:aminotransferase class IV [Phycisphaerales bacterium]
MLIELNGELVEHDRAHVSVFDRGFLFGDGLYEGLRAFTHRGRRRLIAGALHVARLQAGLDEAGIELDASRLLTSTDRVLDANGVSDAFVYWQVTRGTPPLHHGPVRSRIAVSGYRPTTMVYAQPLPPLAFDGPASEPACKRVSLQPDDRWSRGHVKSISLLGNVLGALAGVRDQGEDGAAETLLFRPGPDGGLLSEGTYTNVLIALNRPGVTSSGDPLDDVELVTPSLSSVPILNGVTREVLLRIEPRIVERAVTVGELRRASEVVLLGTTTMVTRVVAISGRAVGVGGGGKSGGVEGDGRVARALQGRLLRALTDAADDAIDPKSVAWRG